MSCLALLAFLTWSGVAPREVDVARIGELTKAFVEAFNAGDADRIMLFYADEYVDVNMRHPRQTKAERRAYFRRLLAPGGLRVNVIPEEIVIDGDHAYARGTIHVVRSRPPDEQTRELRYLEVLRRFPEGWKAIWGIDAEIYPESE